MTDKKLNKISAPKGVPDYVPPASAQFIAVRDTFAHHIRLAGYEHIELPIFEDTTLFARGVGESTDVVSKEMYTFADRGGRSVTLRPEGTAGVMRAVIEHNLDRGQLPVKLGYYGPFFRYERPQAGRYRQLQQVGVEAIGVDDPTLDAEVIALANRCFSSIGLKDDRLKLPLDDATRHRAEINPLRVLDDKRPEVQELTADAPLMLDYLSPQAREHFEAVTGCLDDLGVTYVINPRMVRGLDYYTKTCFEFVHDGLGAQSGIGGGGRYDGLMAQLGGQELSGIGFGLGVDRALLALEAEHTQVADPARVDVYGVALGAPAKRRLLTLINELRAAGIRADMSYGDRGLKGAMKGADRAGARFALVLGDRELDAGIVAVKNLVDHTQTDVPLGQVAETLGHHVRGQ